MTVILGWIAFICLFWSRGNFLDNMYVRSGIAVLLGSMCIALYKIPVIGHILKAATGAVVMYLWGIPIVTFILGFFVPKNVLILIQMICFILGTGIIAYCIFDSTKFGQLETPSIDSFKLHYNLDSLKSKMHFPIAKKNIKKEKKENMNKMMRELQQKQKEINDEYVTIQNERYILQIYKKNIRKERECLEREKQKLREESERFQRERQSMQGNQDIFFFRGCKDRTSCKKRYHKLISEYHPDGIAGDEEIFKKIQNEYETVEKRYSV